LLSACARRQSDLSPGVAQAGPTLQHAALSAAAAYRPGARVRAGAARLGRARAARFWGSRDLPPPPRRKMDRLGRERADRGLSLRSGVPGGAPRPGATVGRAGVRAAGRVE